VFSGVATHTPLNLGAMVGMPAHPASRHATKPSIQPFVLIDICRIAYIPQ
jgi:hypothetical protein